MAFVQILEYDQLTDELAKQVYTEIKNELGFGMVPNLFKSMASRPGFLHANWVKFKTTVLEGSLPRTLKEMVGVAISQHNTSQYALQVHLHGLSALGMSEEVLDTLVNDFDACPLPHVEKLAIRFGLKLATDPHGSSNVDFDELIENGISESEIMELVATANLFTGVNQYTDSIKLEIDDI